MKSSIDDITILPYSLPMFPHNTEMPSPDADRLIHTIIDILHDRRVGTVVDDSRWDGKTRELSLSQLAEENDCLNRAVLYRAEAKERIPSFGFFVDWAIALGTTIDKVAKEAYSRIDKDSKPDE